MDPYPKTLPSLQLGKTVTTKLFTIQDQEGKNYPPLAE
jgi:hypothetical protein